jgi:hypothetical protein
MAPGLSRPARWRRTARRVVGGALNVAAARLMNLGRRPVGDPPLDWATYRALPAPTALDTARLLAGRGNGERARLTEAALGWHGLPVSRQRYRTLEGAGVNLLVDLGAGPRTLLLAAHHDAVPGSPGANDNAAAVGILVRVGERLRQEAPRRLRVRLAFFGGEERAMLGSRVHARRTPLDDLVGVVSLELCGIGDALALWDVTPTLATGPLVGACLEAARALGLVRDETFHLAEPVPYFGSDHRPLADRGVPGLGLTAIPRASIEPLRAFLYGGLRGILVSPARRPPPFQTYHTRADGVATLESAALTRTEAYLLALCRVLDG